MKRMPRQPEPERRYEVTVWNLIEGDIVKKLWDASEEELAEVEGRYADESGYEVQVEEKP